MSHGRSFLPIIILSYSQTSGACERNKSTDSLLLLLSLPLSFSCTYFFSTHSLRVLSTPLPLAGCRVSLSSCHTGPPTLTHGGRERERNSTPTCCQRSSMFLGALIFFSPKGLLALLRRHTAFSIYKLIYIPLQNYISVHFKM